MMVDRVGAGTDLLAENLVTISYMIPRKLGKLCVSQSPHVTNVAKHSTYFLGLIRELNVLMEGK